MTSTPYQDAWTTSLWRKRLFTALDRSLAKGEVVVDVAEDGLQCPQWLRQSRLC